MAQAPNQNTNLYAPPTAAVDDMGTGQTVESLVRFTTWGVVGLSIVTLGIYFIYWLFTRTQRLNRLVPENPISTGFVSATLVVYLLNIAFAVLESWNTSPEFALLSSAVGLASAILVIIWGFQFRSRLHVLRNAAPKSREWLNAVLTFLFGAFYLQYRINLAIDRDRGVAK